MRRLRRLSRQAGVILFVIGSMNACGTLGWQRYLESLSPGNDLKLILFQRCMAPDCTAKVALQRGGETIASLEYEGDASLYAAEVVWSETKAEIGVFACAHYAPAPLVFAYDIQNNRRLSDDIAEAAASAAIRARYKLNPSLSDPLDWLCTPEGATAFEEQAPEMNGFRMLKPMVLRARNLTAAVGNDSGRQQNSNLQ